MRKYHWKDIAYESLGEFLIITGAVIAGYYFFKEAPSSEAVFSIIYITLLLMAGIIFKKRGNDGDWEKLISN